jgi:glycolate oxidase FAD binding subunit
MSDLLRTLAEIVGARHCLTGADRSPYVVDGRTPAAVVSPATAEEAGRVVAAAATAGVAVIPWGGGTRMALGLPPRDGAVIVVTRRLARVLEHEPGDLTATVEAGMTMAALQEALGARGQWASLDPPFPARSTLGGVLAADASGPRRYLYGGARDLVIGLGVVGPDGALVRAGGKVVKNVAGYDLAKLYIGSLGTLGLIVEATLKLRPRPEADQACCGAFDSLPAAAAAARTVMGSDLVPHSLELLDARAGALCGAEAGVAAGAGAALLVGFDGLARTVAWQVEEGARLLRGAGARAVTTLVDAGPALAAVRDVRAAVPAPLAAARAVLLPTEVGRYAGEAAGLARTAGLDLVTTAHAGNGVVHLVIGAGPGGDATGPRVRATVKTLAGLRDQARAAGGEFVVEWAPLAVKEEIGPWDPPGPAVRLMERIKAQLDPRGIMNPGRFVGGL